MDKNTDKGFKGHLIKFTLLNKNHKTFLYIFSIFLKIYIINDDWQSYGQSKLHTECLEQQEIQFLYFYPQKLWKLAQKHQR